MIDLDATLITAHSDKQGAAGIYKGGLGFHPLAAWLDRGDGTGEPLATGPPARRRRGQHRRRPDRRGRPRPCPAPSPGTQQQPILVRADSAGATHGLVNHLYAQGMRFSVGFDLDSWCGSRS